MKHGIWIRKVVEHFRWGLMGHTSRIREDGGAESKVDYDSSAHEDSEEKSISKGPRQCFCDIFLAKNFLFLSKNMPETKLKSSGLMLRL